MQHEAYAKAAALNSLSSSQLGLQPNSQDYSQVQSASCDVARPSTGLEAVGQRLVRYIHFSSSLADKLENLEIKLVGSGKPAPSNQKTSQVSPVPSGYVAQMNVGFSELEARLARMDEILDRLTAVI